MNQRQRVAVASDLVFRATPWRCVADDQGLQPRGRDDNAFQPVGRLGGLNHRNLAQPLEGFERLRSIEPLLALVLARCAQRGQLRAIEAKRSAARYSGTSECLEIKPG